MFLKKSYFFNRLLNRTTFPLCWVKELISVMSELSQNSLTPQTIYCSVLNLNVIWTHANYC